METESPRALGKREGRIVHCGEHPGSIKNHPILQPFDEVNRLRAAHLVNRFALHPETAAAVALLAFGSAAQ